jgi:hypothetical protein
MSAITRRDFVMLRKSMRCGYIGVHENQVAALAALDLLVPLAPKLVARAN